MKHILIGFLFISFFANSQSSIDSLSVNNKNYLEDQLFASVTYSLLTNKPTGIDLRGVSNTVSFGYLRDLPFDKKSNFGIAIGLGYSQNTYFHNMKITDIDGQTHFSPFSDLDDYDSNKLVFHTIDLPFEFRIRKSTYKETKFWRYYFGWKLSYVIYHKSEFNLITDVKTYRNFDHFNKMQYGVTASVGHGTWNGYFYYGLTNIFDNAQFNETEKINMKSLQFGLIFYIL